MRTLRLKLTIPATEPPSAARETFQRVADLHEDQAIFQVNRTAYVTRDEWGFRVTYRSQEAFVQTTSVRELEATMAQVAPHTFQRRVTDERE